MTHMSLSLFLCSTLPTKRVKVDSNPISVKIHAGDCISDKEARKYDPISITFVNLDNQPSLRKLNWHEDDLVTTVYTFLEQ